ncbi:GH3 family domain-containing protein [Legionella waltersii]|uniref:GH3 auxin-responsive promoter n=1 Tax=Legionella waltersii TaxID=66969 RepID=A0A0W0ZZT5_9GAMM|nr:GH3 auxin-responsive promoter family protein [Legionella waltersii]KTD74626.1 GH3 auxin-responsive promoter [Legionella waltersii]SNV08873.1 plant auxin-responsive GH3-like protein [Legionella waltersii]
MNWKRWLISKLTQQKYKQFIEDTKHPQHARARLWNAETLPLMQKSAYWKPILEKNSSLKLEDFPISEYETYEKELLSAQESTIQPFNGEKLIFWSETSGTSGVRKYFPITQSFQQQFQRTMGPFVHSLTQRFSGFFKEKLLYLVAVDANRTTPSGTPCGWISHFNYRHLPRFIKRFYAMPVEVFASQENYENWGPVYALATDLSAIFAVTPMVIDVFYERCSAGLDEYLLYLLGKKSMPKHLPKLKISRKRLNHLKQLIGKTRPSFKDLWPSLELSGCWTSGLCKYPAQQLQQKMGKAICLVDGTYSATEGWLTVPLDNEQQGGVLHPGAHIAEFIPEGDEIHPDNLLQCWELDPGKKYEIFITTAMGFVRYRLKDIVLCTGYLNSAPILEFCYKTQLLKLETCALTGQELQEMLIAVSFSMEPHWYFARNSLGDRIVLVVDDLAIIPDTLLKTMHQELIRISPTYSHSVEHGEVAPIVLFQKAKEDLIASSHGQTKPKLISYEVVSEI